jgi:hypothetical protein
MSKTENILLSLKYCWMLNREHIQRLHFPDKSIKAVQDVLTNLKDQGLVDKLNWGNPDRQPSMWFLTDAGDRTIRRLAAYPEGRRHSRPRSVLEHDKRTLDMIVNIIEIARDTGLCGIKVFREVKLNPDPKVKKPILDALMIFEVGGKFSYEHPDLVPWSLDKPLTDESLWRVCLEADNHTEANQIIAGKAVSYQLVLQNAAWREWWVARYGWAMPSVIWVAPSDERVASIVAHWEATWPDGQWLATSDEGLERNIWTIHEDRQTWHNQPIFFRSQPSKPATTKATPAQPGQSRSAEQSPQQSEADQKRRQEEQDARDFALPLNQRLLQLNCPAFMTGELDEHGRPCYRNGRKNADNPRFRSEEVEALIAYITQQQAIAHERERLHQEQQRIDAETQRVQWERRRALWEQQKKENDARAAAELAAQEKKARRVAVKRRMTTVAIDMALLGLIIAACLLLFGLFNFIYQSPAEIRAAQDRTRLEQGMGQCAQLTEPATLWHDKPDGDSSTTLRAGIHVTRLGETWDSWPLPDQWVRVKTYREGLGGWNIGWVDQQFLVACPTE